MTRYGASTTILGRLPSGLTVTMALYKASDGSSVTITNTCTEMGSTGVYRWPSSNITTQPTVETDYFYRMTTGQYQYEGKFTLISKALAWNSAWDAEVQSECADALTTYGPPTRTEATADKNAIITEVNANETKIDALQADLDNPNQYKADVSALATSAEVSKVGKKVDRNFVWLLP